MLVPNKNPQRYTEYVISFISFAFGEVVTTIYFLANVKLYVSNIEESYKERIIGNLVNSVTADSLLHKYSVGGHVQLMKKSGTCLWLCTVYA